MRETLGRGVSFVGVDLPWYLDAAWFLALALPLVALAYGLRHIATLSSTPAAQALRRRQVLRALALLWLVALAVIWVWNRHLPWP